MNIPNPPATTYGLGALIALVVLVLAIGLMAFEYHHATWTLSLIAALAVARLT